MDIIIFNHGYLSNFGQIYDDYLMIVDIIFHSWCHKNYAASARMRKNTWHQPRFCPSNFPVTHGFQPIFRFLKWLDLFWWANHGQSVFVTFWKHDLYLVYFIHFCPKKNPSLHWAPNKQKTSSTFHEKTSHLSVWLTIFMALANRS